MSELIKLTPEAIALLKAMFVTDGDGAVAFKLKFVTALDYPDRAVTSSNGLDVAQMLRKCMEIDAEGVVSFIVARDENVENGLLLGEAADTAYRGDRGKIAYDFSQAFATAVATLTNKRITKRGASAASGATLDVNVDNIDYAVRTLQAANLTINAPTGTPTENQELEYILTADGTLRTLTFNAAFAALGVVIPANIPASKTVYIKAKWNVTAAKWFIMDVKTQA